MAINDIEHFFKHELLRIGLATAGNVDDIHGEKVATANQMREGTVDAHTIPRFGFDGLHIDPEVFDDGNAFGFTPVQVPGLLEFEWGCICETLIV